MKNELLRASWLKWAMEIQSIAQVGWANEKNTKEQIKMCFEAKNSKAWETIFD